MKREVVNKMLLLKLLELSGKIHEQKLSYLVFILQYEGRKERKTTFNYEFVKWNIEPHSAELEKDLVQLEAEQLITRGSGVSLDEKGKFFLYKTQKFYQNHQVVPFFQFFVYIHGQTALYSIMDYIYKRYEIAKHPTGGIVAAVLEEEVPEVHLPAVQVHLEEAKKEISARFEELHQHEEHYVTRTRALLDASFLNLEDEESAG